MFEGVDDLLLDLADTPLDCESTLLLLLFEFRTESLTIGWSCASDRRTVTIESVGSGEVFLGISIVAL